MPAERIRAAARVHRQRRRLHPPQHRRAKHTAGAGSAHPTGSLEAIVGFDQASRNAQVDAFPTLARSRAAATSCCAPQLIGRLSRRSQVLVDVRSTLPVSQSACGDLGAERRGQIDVPENRAGADSAVKRRDRVRLKRESGLLRTGARDCSIPTIPC